MKAAVGSKINFSTTKDEGHFRLSQIIAPCQTKKHGAGKGDKKIKKLKSHELLMNWWNAGSLS